MRFAQCFCVMAGLLIVHGSLGLSDQEELSLAECLMRCGVGLSLMVGGVWLPKLRKLFPHKRRNIPFSPAPSQLEQENWRDAE